ncbi:MAG: hypothetical protein LBU10_03425 [Endomicrobium sp.]|jgi:hypothetical protein|nr:hypothetical protein [Endomicrobium sp.]
MSENLYNITVIRNDKGIIRRIGASDTKYESVEMFLSRGTRGKASRKLRGLAVDIKNEINKELKQLWLKK